MCWGTLVAAEFLAGTTGIGFVTLRKIIEKTIPWRGKG